MSKRSRLQKLMEVFDPSKGTAVDFSQFDNEINRLKEALTEKIQAQTVDDVLSQLEKFKKRLDFKSLLEAMVNLETTLDRKIKGVTGEMSLKVDELKELLASDEENVNDQVSSIASKYESLKQELGTLSEQKNTELAGLKEKITQLFDSSLRATDTFLEIQKTIDKDKEEAKKNIKEFSEILDRVRTEFTNHITNLPRGGSAPFQVNVNSSVASSKYADINFRAGTNVTLSKADDDTNKRVNITITSSGGAGGNPGGNDTELQFNDGGAFGGDIALTWASSIFTIGQPGSVKGNIRLSGAVAQSITIQPASTAGNWTMTLPPNDGSANQVLTTDGNGITTWASVAGGSATPGGNTGELQFNDGGNFGGASTVSWNKNASILQVNGQLHIPNDTALRFGGGGGGSATDLKTGSDGTFLFDTGSNENIKFKGGEDAGATTWGYTDTGFNYVFQSDTLGRTTQKGGATIGVQGSVKGTVALAGGVSGSMTIQPASTAGSWTLTLPINDGSSGQYLLTDGNGITQWASVTAVGGSGITRSVSVISVSSTLAAAAATDYVIFANVGIQVTLPTAISNVNLYTVKNLAASSILVTTTAGETIDGSASALMDNVNQSLSFVSNNSVWGVV